MYKEKLPYSQSALILGITSIITACCCWGIIGVITGFIGIYYANKAIAIHSDNPEMYDGINNAQTGRVTAIIGVVIGVLSVTWMIYLFSTGNYEMMIEQYDGMMEDFE